MKKLYLSQKTKFILTLTFSFIWVAVSLWLGQWWLSELTSALGIVFGVWAILGISILPGLMANIMSFGVIFDKQRDTQILENLPDVTILIAAYNEEEGIGETLEYLHKYPYNGNLFVKVIDNNSKDNTKNIILDCIEKYKDVNIEYMFQPLQGKFNALNMALETVNTEYVITLDADTILHKDALNYLVSRMVTENKTKKVGAVAGGIFVRNSRENVLTRMQEWDYFLSITGIKRSQGLFQSTLVAQGAFSIYDTELLKKLGGWGDTIGEDIVLTWDIMKEGYMSLYEPLSVAFTNVPTKLSVFLKQRARWARGMIEGLKRNNVFKYPRFEQKFLILCDYTLFVIDSSIVLFWIPGIIIALLFHNFLIVGPATLLMLPMTVVMFSILYNKEKNLVFDIEVLKVRRSFFGLISFVLFYQLIMAPTSCCGYIQEILHLRRNWK